MIKNINVDLNKIKRLGLTYALVIGTSFSNSGCSKDVDCNIEIPHIHKYVSDKGYTTYFDSEKDTHDGFNRRDDYIKIESSDSKKYEFEDLNNLMKIEENTGLIKELEDEFRTFSHTEYQYIKKEEEYVYDLLQDDYVLKQVEKKKWSLNKNMSSLTGKTRHIDYKFIGYKIVKKSKREGLRKKISDFFGISEYKIEKSKPVDDILEIKDEYPYIMYSSGTAKMAIEIIDGDVEGSLITDTTNLKEDKKWYPEAYDDYNIKVKRK